MINTRLTRVTGLLLAMMLSSSSLAVQPDSEPPPPGQPDDYSLAREAIEKSDWQAAVELLQKVVEQRDWDDDAHNLLGFAYRKLEDYEQSLKYYDKALTLNPYHRGALEYLGETYLAMQRPDDAQATLQTLADVCRLSDMENADCPEWKLLQQAISQYNSGEPLADNAQWTTANGTLDTSSTRLSEQQSFQASYHCELKPIPINRMHSWVLELQTADGEPLENAEISVDGGMPDHDHGLPSSPQVTRYLGDGRYQVEGLKFHMNGWWQVEFHVTTGGDEDSVRFDLML